MWKRIFITAMMATMLLFAPHRSPAQIPIIDILKAVAKAVIRKIDLKVQKQQNKVIWLQNAQKVLENTMSKLKLEDISGWAERQRDLYDAYYQELWRVKNAITTYSRVKDIVTRQLRLVEEYKRAWGLLSRDRHFTPAEREEMYRVYSGILEESLKNIDQLMLVASSFRTQMSDGERMALIKAAGDRLEENLTDLRSFNGRNFRLSIGRAASFNEAAMLRKLYGIP